MTTGKFPNGLKEAMEKAEIGVTALGRLIDEPKQNVERWAKGQRRLRPDVAARIAPHVGRTVAALLLLPEVPDTPVAGRTGAGGAIIDVDADIGEHVRRVAVVSGYPAAAAEVSGLSMGSLFEGWYAIISERDAFHDGLYGQLCVMETDDGEVLIKWIERTRRKGVRLVSGDGSEHADGVQLRWAAKVIGMRPPQ